jgi:hypothetical protein
MAVAWAGMGKAVVEEQGWNSCMMMLELEILGCFSRRINAMVGTNQFTLYTQCKDESRYSKDHLPSYYILATATPS